MAAWLDQLVNSAPADDKRVQAMLAAVQAVVGQYGDNAVEVIAVLVGAATTTAAIAGSEGLAALMGASIALMVAIEALAQHSGAPVPTPVAQPKTGAN